MRLLCVTGIRSDYDILYPVLSELKKANHELIIVVSGAHLSDQHNNTYKRIIEDGFQIADKVDTLLSTDRAVQRSKGTGLLIQGLTQTVERTDPDFLLVLGDREESIATAIVGNYMEKLVVHIGGGDPVYGNADDPMRFAVSKLAHIHCCTAQPYAENLQKIGEENFRIFFTGNPAYANIDFVPVIEKENLMNQLDIKSKNYIVIIKHPLSSEVEFAGEQMETALKSLDAFCDKHNFQVVCIPPNSDPGSHKMKIVLEKYSEKDWLIKAETLPRLQFINLMRHARALVGNSSMGILEAPYYKLPVVNIGNRQQGRLNAGNVEFVPYINDEIILAVEKATLDEEYRQKIKNLKNPFGDSSAPQKVMEAIESVDINDRKWYVKQKLC
ncbi:UDP-N-acetylglucosamine 2-epimerase [Candidatus Marinimicrobia bacterium]|nr:UDP-N-acetylglucosamine 2-epimerase [Candidatus Neomarinimicrobiota bacterium]